MTFMLLKNLSTYKMQFFVQLLQLVLVYQLMEKNNLYFLVLQVQVGEKVQKNVTLLIMAKYFLSNI